MARVALERFTAYLAGMPSYRFFGLPLAGDAPTERKFFNDQVAMGWALRMTDAGGVEVWEGSRFVARLHAAAPPNSAA